MIGAAVLCLIGMSTSAEARSHHRHHRHHAYYHHVYHHRHYASNRYESRGGRPSAWCGWYMRSQVGSDPGPAYNLARTWAHYGSNAGGPAVGTIVVWRHHVGKIVGQEHGQWIVESGNDGNAVRTRPRSVAGAIAFRTMFDGFQAAFTPFFSGLPWNQ